MKKDNMKYDDINKVMDQLGEAWEATLNALLKRPLSLDEIAESYSGRTDQFIIEVEKKEKVRFIAGKFFIKHVRNDSCIAQADLYFKNVEDDRWVKKELKGKIPAENLTDDSKLYIRKEEVKEYDISHPGE